MDNNGHQQLDWLDRVRVYAALDQVEDLGEASAILAQQGLALPRPQLAAYRRQGAHKVERMRDSGLAPALLGETGRRQARVHRLDALCQRLEDRMRTEEVSLDRDLASVLQQYRELMALTCMQDASDGETDEQRATREQASQSVAETLTLLEALNDEEVPSGDFAEDLCHTARRLAAATGHAFSAPQSVQSPLAAKPADL